MAELAKLDISLHMGSALDFGSGAGRLSRALAGRFESVVGADLSSTMVAEARRLNTDISNLRFEHMASRGLPSLPSKSFDFVYSRLVLQHIEPAFALEYIRDFVRVLRDGGVAMFSAPARDPRPDLGGIRPALRVLRELVPGMVHMSVFALPRKQVEVAVSSAGGRLVAALPDEAPPGWPGFVYVVARAPK
jgi:2-polyprenyl-3-methyl-5-hydroxy-6-metoxy-1,4-benzoquinol methylase